MFLDKRMPLGHLVSSPPQSPPQEAAMTPSLDRTTLALPSETRSRYELEPQRDSRAPTTDHSRAGVIPAWRRPQGLGLPPPAPCQHPLPSGTVAFQLATGSGPCALGAQNLRMAETGQAFAPSLPESWGLPPRTPAPGALESRLLCCRCCAAAARKPRASGPGGGSAGAREARPGRGLPWRPGSQALLWG